MPPPAEAAGSAVLRERRSLRLPSTRGLRVRSTGVHAAALRALAARLGEEAGPSAAGLAGGRRGARAGRAALSARLVAVEPDTGGPVPRFEVLVEVEGTVAGRLPRGEAPLWHAPLTRAQEAGAEVTCAALLACGPEPVLSLRVCEPEHLRLMLTTPSWALPLVPECTVTLSGARLSDELLAQVTRRMVDWVTLHPVTVSHGRHLGSPGVEVRLEGQRVGEFSAAAGARYRTLIDAAGEQAKTPLARARLRGDDRWIELDVLMPRP